MVRVSTQTLVSGHHFGDVIRQGNGVYTIGINIHLVSPSSTQDSWQRIFLSIISILNAGAEVGEIKAGSKIRLSVSVHKRIGFVEGGKIKTKTVPCIES